MELVRPVIADKPVDLAPGRRPAAAPVRIYTDPDKLRQILKNFLANAIKFTEQGGVTVHLRGRAEPGRRWPSASPTPASAFPTDKQAIIFEAFQQADGSTRRRYRRHRSRALHQPRTGQAARGAHRGRERTGGRCPLHPAVCRWQVDTGSVAGRTPPREPSRTRHEASRRCSKMQPEAAAKGGDYAGHWVLIVERDVASSGGGLTRMLESFGLRVQTAADLDEALETLQEEGWLRPGPAGRTWCRLAIPVIRFKAIRLDAPGGTLPLVVIGRFGETESPRQLS